MDQKWALIVATLLALCIARALVRGDAAAGEGIKRDESPIAYWGIIAAGLAGLVLLLAVAWRA